jgi:hypothetical protein
MEGLKPREKARDLTTKIPKAKRAESMAQVVEHLLGICKNLNSNPVLPKKKEEGALGQLFWSLGLKSILLGRCDKGTLRHWDIPQTSLALEWPG